MNEQQVKDNIIEPILHSLGYIKNFDSEIKIMKEVGLKYPYATIGTTKKPIVGKADFIIEVNNKSCLVIEAK
ncbi:MAG: hypothetical protein EAZ31_00890, partial [Cytophagia bacterium]